MESVKLTLPWDVVVSKNRKYTVTRSGRMILSKQYRDGKEDIQKIAMANYDGDVLDGELNMVMESFEPDKRRRDHYNLGQIIMDGLEGVVYENDYQIRKATSERTGLDRDNPRVEVTITSYE